MHVNVWMNRRVGMGSRLGSHAYRQPEGVRGRQARVKRATMHVRQQARMQAGGGTWEGQHTLQNLWKKPSIWKHV